MAYASWSVTFGEQPSAAKWNILGTNDASFNDGTGIFGLYKNLLATDSNPYKFSVYRNGAFSNDAGAFKKITFETETFDTNSNFDSSTNYRYTAPVTGFYQLSGYYGFATNPSTFAIVSLYKNGSELERGIQQNASNASGSSYAGFVSLSASDYIELFCYGTNAVSMDTNAATRGKFQGFLVCRT